MAGSQKERTAYYWRLITEAENKAKHGDPFDCKLIDELPKIAEEMNRSGNMRLARAALKASEKLHEARIKNLNEDVLSTHQRLLESRFGPQDQTPKDGEEEGSNGGPTERKKNA